MKKILLVFLLTIFTTYVFSQNISGVVNDETGTPLIGVTVVVKGTTNGTATGADGSYTLQVNNINSAVLQFSFIGYKTLEVAISGQSVVNVSMQPSELFLEEVIAIGYGTVKKQDLTGSVGSVTTESIVERGTTSPLQAMQGQIAGVQITNATGRIGDGFNITIRGKNSMRSDANPLYIVDGVPTDDIDFLNPQDIERIDALKDASSSAIYGSRGSNGVILVTTKSGAQVKGSANISYNGYYGVRQVARLPKMMDGEKWWYYHQSAYLATAGKDPDLGYVTPETLFAAVIGANNSELLRRATNNETFDWYDAVLQTGQQQNHFLNFSGMSNNGMAYNFGIGYQKETGNLKKESLDKYSFKASVSHKFNEKFDFGATFTGSFTDRELGSSLAMREAFRLNPFATPYYAYGDLTRLWPQPGKLKDEDGNWIFNKTSTYNPLLEIENSTNNQRRYNGVGNMFMSYKPIEWLTLKSAINVGFDMLRTGRAWGKLTNTGNSNLNDSNEPTPSGDKTYNENLNYTWDNQIDINKNFGDHSLAITGVQSFFTSRTESAYLYSRFHPFDNTYHNLGSGPQSTFNINSNYIKQTLESYSFRVNYSFKGKYLLTLSNRWDGSSLLSEGNKWNAFPSGAIAWRIAEESFMDDAEAISNLKLRVSYGFTGNNIVTPYSTVNKLDNQTYYDFFGTTANGWLPSSIANTALTWEKTEEINLGLDFGLFNNRVSGSIDVYNRLSDELLMSQQLPKESGWNTMQANVGSVRNKGFEFAASTVIIDKNDWNWTTSLTFTKNTNEIVSLYGQDKVDDIGNGWFIGESIDAQYNYKFDGIWQADEKDRAAIYGQTEGQAKVVDLNNDDKITAEDDRMILGSADPDWTGSLSSQLSYKNFDLGINLYTVQGTFVLSGFHSNFTNTRDRGRQKLDIEWYIPENNAGIPAQASNEYPQPRNMGTYWRNDNVGYYRDVSFVKVQNITLGYTFDSSLLEKINIKKCRIYANILNPFVFTDYDGYDPEWAGASYNDGGVSSIVYQFGVNVNF